MKFLAVTLLAVCLVHGNNAQLLSSLSSGVSSLRSGVSSLRSGVSSLANDVISTVDKALDTQLNSFSSTGSGTVQNILNQATSGASVDNVTSLASTLTDEQLLELVNGATSEVTTQLIDANKGTLRNAVNSLKDTALNTVVNAVHGSSSAQATVRAALKTAAAAGIEVRDCLVEGANASGNADLSNAINCVSGLIDQTTGLAENLTSTVFDSVALVQDARSKLEVCSNKESIDRVVCDGRVLLPIVRRSVSILAETAREATQVVGLVATLRSTGPACVAGVTVPTVSQAVKLTASVVSCLSKKVSTSA